MEPESGAACPWSGRRGRRRGIRDEVEPEEALEVFVIHSPTRIGVSSEFRRR